jgi:hypothetical protein
MVKAIADLNFCTPLNRHEARRKDERFVRNGITSET